MLGSPYIPRWLRLPGLIDVSEWSLEEKEKLIKKNIIVKDPRKTYFLHAPSSGLKKGTPIIRKLLEECKNEGMPIEVLYVSQLPQEKAKQIYAYADYAIDQVGSGTFGLFGNEMMCWQIPVLVYQTDEWDRRRNFPPVIKILKKTFKEQVRRCIEMKKTGEIVELGKKGRQWVIENSDFSLSLPKYLTIYKKLFEGNEIPQHCNRRWYQQEHMLQNGVKSELYRYLIEENVFEKIGIRVQDYDKRLYY